MLFHSTRDTAAPQGFEILHGQILPDPSRGNQQQPAQVAPGSL